MPVGDPGEDVLEVGLRVQPVEPRRDDEGIDGCRPLAAVVGAGAIVPGFWHLKLWSPTRFTRWSGRRF